MAAPSPEGLTNTTPLEKYLEHAQTMKIIDEKGHLLISGPPLILESADQDELLIFWKKPQTFEKNGVVFSWNFYQFLTCFVPYFTKTFKGTTVTLTEGTYHAVGKPFWKKNLQQIANSPLIEAEELWSFCETPPRYYQFEVHFPKNFSEFNTEAILEKFHQLSLYLLIVQKLPNPPGSFPEALHEFDALLKSPEESESLRLQELRTLMKTVEKITQNSTVEIPFAPDASLRIAFSFQNSFSDHLRLKIDTGNPFSYELISSFSKLHDRFIHRLLLSFPSIQETIGKYWADITFNGSAFNEKELECQLIKLAMNSQEDLPKTFLKAFDEGKKHLPRGADALAVYTFNALLFLKRHHVSLENLETPQTPLGKFLASNIPIESLQAVLQIIGVLQAGLKEPQAHISSKKSQLEICWKNPHAVYLVLPYNLEKALDQKPISSCLSEALELFFPSFSASSKVSFNHRWEEIYFALQSDERFSDAALRLFLLLQGERPITENDVLALPAWLSDVEKLPLISKAFKESVFFPVYSKVEKAILALDNPTPETCRLAAWHALLTCSEPKILPLAWASYAKLYPSPTPEEVKFLLECAPHLETTTLPFVLNRVCQSGNVPLLAYYLDRVLRFSDPQISAYQSKLLEAAPSIGIFYPKIFEARLNQLKESMSRLKTHPLDWWNDFHKIKKIASGNQTEACDLLFQDALTVLVSSYLPLSLQNAESVIDHLFESLRFFKSTKDPRITQPIQTLTTFLKERPQEKQLWSKYTVLIEQLKKEDAFIEPLLAALEILASMKDPPFQCFKTAIPKLKTRLSDPEQKRLAAVYGLVILKTKKGNELKGALPSLQWLMEHLRTPDTWEIFAGIALYFHPKPSLEIADASWIAPHLLSAPHSSVLEGFIQYLLSQNLKALSASDLKFAIAGLIARTTHRTKELFQLWMKLPSKEEKKFFDRCRDLYSKNSMEALKKLLEEYFAPPPSPQAQITENLSKNPLSLETLNLMKKLPSTELAPWQEVFAILDQQPNDNLLKETWQIWLETHPLQNISPAEEEYWNLAIHICFRSILPMKNEFCTFLTDSLLSLLIQLNGKTCQIVTASCLNVATAICWIEEENRSQRLHALEKILSSPELKAKIGDPWLYLRQTCEARLAILLAHQPAPALSSLGHQTVILMMADIDLDENYGTENNKKLFHAYCLRPYALEDPFQQYIFHSWIEKSWASLKSTLSWEMACRVVKSLCKFDYKEQGPEKTSFDAMTIYRKWEELATGSWGGSLVLNENAAIEFLNTTCSVTTVFSKNPADPQLIFSTLITLHQKFYGFINQFANLDPLLLSRFQMSHCSNVFYLISIKKPENHQILQLALENLNKAQEFIKKNFTESSAYAVDSLISSLPQILEMSAPHEHLMNLIQTILKGLMDTPWVVLARIEEDYSWFRLLTMLCSSAQMMPSEKRETVNRFVMNVFMNCTHAARLQGRPLAPIIIKSSIPVLAASFLSLPLSTLKTQDFETLIRGLTIPNIEEMLFYLSKPDAYYNHNKLCLHSLAASRLIHYMNRDHTIKNYQAYCLKPLPSFNPDEPIFIQLLIRSEWIKTIAALMQHAEPLRIHKIKLTQEITPLILSLIKEETFKTYSTSLIEIVGHDPEIATAMLGSFQIPSGITPELALKLNQLKSFIQTKISG